ncbi:TIGR03915 family putative DNA repair protein [Pedobacter helvus]|uniref:TIGR03915 family putative DNA repair protein n=1 Tax=Pedobacter helvus TaxID=2563444 RepID=A0ABW9JMP4_9SPHI|nr:TIGR03915 family putative DNA repair protein [Pedobacter ureilyticus]
MIYIFDGSLEGLLTAVFEWFERKPGLTKIVSEERHQPNVFSQSFEVLTDRAKADRVWNGLAKRLDRNWMRKIYCTYLSEIPEMHQEIFGFCCYIFQHQAGAEKNYGNAQVLNITQTARKVEREKHRMEAFIRFQKTADGMFYCGIDPDFNVIPLLVNHFKNRYADQQWIIYDIKRHYGIYYNLQTVEEIKIDIDKSLMKKANQHLLDEQETLYADLWKDYFKSTNIVARKNTKLHTQHVPKRYWKYLTEKL